MSMPNKARKSGDKALIEPGRVIQERKKIGSVANSIFEGIERFNLLIWQIGIANFTGVF
jgi:hypothetical protein